MPVKVRFSFLTEASPVNPQSTVVRVKNMQFIDDDAVYEFPPHRQALEHHEELMKMTAAKTAN